MINGDTLWNEIQNNIENAGELTSQKVHSIMSDTINSYINDNATVTVQFSGTNPTTGVPEILSVPGRMRLNISTTPSSDVNSLLTQITTGVKSSMITIDESTLITPNIISLSTAPTVELLNFNPSKYSENFIQEFYNIFIDYIKGLRPIQAANHSVFVGTLSVVSLT